MAKPSPLVAIPDPKVRAVLERLHAQADEGTEFSVRVACAS